MPHRQTARLRLLVQLYGQAAQRMSLAQQVRLPGLITSCVQDQHMCWSCNDMLAADFSKSLPCLKVSEGLCGGPLRQHYSGISAIEGPAAFSADYCRVPQHHFQRLRHHLCGSLLRQHCSDIPGQQLLTAALSDRAWMWAAKPCTSPVQQPAAPALQWHPWQPGPAAPPGSP